MCKMHKSIAQSLCILPLYTLRNVWYNIVTRKEERQAAGNKAKEAVNSLGSYSIFPQNSFTIKEKQHEKVQSQQYHECGMENLP